MAIEPDDWRDPAAYAQRLSVQAELLALNAMMESARGGDRDGHWQRLAAEARELARCGREAALRHQREREAEQAVGRLIDEGLADAPIEAGGAFDAAARLAGFTVLLESRLARPH